MIYNYNVNSFQKAFSRTRGLTPATMATKAIRTYFRIPFVENKRHEGLSQSQLKSRQPWVKDASPPYDVELASLAAVVLPAVLVTGS